MKYIDHFLAAKEDDVFLLRLYEKSALVEFQEWALTNAVKLEEVQTLGWAGEHDGLFYLGFSGSTDPNLIRFSEQYGGIGQSKNPDKYRLEQVSFFQWVERNGDQLYSFAKKICR